MIVPAQITPVTKMKSASRTPISNLDGILVEPSTYILESFGNALDSHKITSISQSTEVYMIQQLGDAPVTLPSFVNGISADHLARLSNAETTLALASKQTPLDCSCTLQAGIILKRHPYIEPYMTLGNINLLGN